MGQITGDTYTEGCLGRKGKHYSSFNGHSLNCSQMLMHVLPPVTCYPAMVVHLYFCNMHTECVMYRLLPRMH